MFIPYEPKFGEEIDNLLKQAPYYLIWGEKASFTLLALEEDRIVGVGSLWNNSIHPYRDYISIYIHPDYRKKGIGKELFDQLFLASNTKKLQITIQSTDQQALDFLNKCGFKLARKCYTPVLKEAKPTHSENNMFIHGEIASFGMASEDNQKDTLEMQLKNYIDFHQMINPLSEEMTMTKWKEIILEDLSFTHSKLLIVDGEVMAYIFFYNTENSNEIEVGYIGGKDIQQIESYLPFYKWTIEQMIAQYEIMSIEADDVDPYAFAALNNFQYDASLSLDAYIL
ncbi:GNAT family N-acetyltransferase [Desemzia sp. FAM 23991]|uniref:GNAT family N-acetyltransferase n=1 Tax=unclassified Desemzia TaxID=2685243 RepID=UPI0038852EBC